MNKGNEMPIRNINAVKIGDKVSYEDMANPYTEYTIVGTPADLPANEWGYKYFHAKDENGTHREILFGQYGWNHHPQVTTV